LREAYPEIIDTYDISHKLACLLKGELSHDARWQAFLTACAQARPRLQQTQGSCLMPPEVRVKARYMNLDRQVRWAQRRLDYLDGPDDPQLAKKLGLTAAQTRLWLAERLGWLRGFRDDMTLYGAMMQVVRVAQTVVKQEGLRRDSALHVTRALPTDLPDHPRLQRLTDQVHQYLVEESAKLPDDEGYLGSSDIIESLFGKHKLFTANGTHKGIGPSILLLPLLTANWTSTLVRDALESELPPNSHHGERRRQAGRGQVKSDRERTLRRVRELQAVHETGSKGIDELPRDRRPHHRTQLSGNPSRSDVLIAEDDAALRRLLEVVTWAAWRRWPSITPYER